jgi:hypothetical protein
VKTRKAATRARSHNAGLTLDQQSAVDLLASGKTDTETAELLKLNRVSVTRWRLYDPAFQAALNVRRADIWGAAAERLRALLPKAIDALADALSDADNLDRVNVALAVLKLIGPLAAPPIGPTDPDEIVRQRVNARFEMHRTIREQRAEINRSNGDYFTEPPALPTLEMLEAKVRAEIRDALSEPVGPSEAKPIGAANRSAVPVKQLPFRAGEGSREDCTQERRE